MPPERMTFKVEDAQLLWTNFSGKEGMYNREGERFFTVVLDLEAASQMEEDGWNVKIPSPEEIEDGKNPTIKVGVRYDVYAPNITLITSAGPQRVTEDMVDILDSINYETVDLICRSYRWEVGPKSGIKAYLKTMFITVAEDDLERKYAKMELDS